MLTGSAFNAFLKTLEEPPPHAIFILATTEKHKIIPTVLSRCQTFDFKRITVQDITSHLQSIAVKEGMIAQEAALHVIAQKSEGGMRDALSMLDRIASFTNGMLTYSNTMEHLNLLDAEYYFRLTDSMLSQDVAGTLLLLDQALEKGFEGDVIINGLAEHFRNLLLCKDARMAKLLDVPNDFRPVYNEKANQTPPSFILSALNVINDSELNYKSATNKRLHVEMCLIRLCFLLQSLSPALSIGEGVLADVKKNNSPIGNTPVPAIAETKNSSINSSNSVDNQIIENKNSIIEPPQPEVSRPAHATINIPVPATEISPNTQPQAKGRRLSRGMLSDIDAKVNQASENQNEEKQVLSEEVGLGLFEKYKQKLQAASKSVIYAQFCMMRVEVYPPDEVRIISPSELTDTYAREQRTQLIDYYREETKIMVRITTEIQEDEAVKAAQNPIVLSKSEIYDAMVNKNPSLSKLKEGLGMNIEY